MTVRRLFFAASLLLVPGLAFAQAPPPPPKQHRVFYGGGIGLAFGDVDYVEVAPLVGLRATPKLDVGLSVLYRWRSDGRHSPSIDTSDYGATLFGRFRVARSFFLEADWEYLDWEYALADRSTDRRSDTSLLAGGGYFQPLGRGTALAVSALYNFSYDDNDPFEPYGDPWVLRVGINVGF